MAKLSIDSSQKRTLVCLLLGYAGYYFCRSNLSVSAPLLIKEFSSQGLDKIALGGIVSTGVLVYAIGKILNGIIGDFLGGKKTFLMGMAGSILFTILFGISAGLAAFTIFWVANRYFQSMGWSALIKTVSQWFDHLSYARIMGILSLSFLFGDAIARYVFSQIISQGFGWREIFYTAAGVFGIIAVINYIFLPGKKSGESKDDTSVHPQNLYRDTKIKVNLKQLLLPVLKSPVFWTVVIMSIGLTLIRETFNFWIPTYLTEAAGYTPQNAAKFSLLFPFFGGLSVVFFGRLADNKMSGKKSLIVIACLSLLCLILWLMGNISSSMPIYVHLVLISLASFLIIGPYSFLAGAMSLDLGGKTGSSTVAGLVDSAGYFGATFSGIGVAKLATSYGWNKVFFVLAVVAVITLLAAVLYRKIFEITKSASLDQINNV
jgi:OPA family glycerol-3-phosphate transporter-like MFS transporter